MFTDKSSWKLFLSVIIGCFLCSCKNDNKVSEQLINKQPVVEQVQTEVTQEKENLSIVGEWETTNHEGEKIHFSIKDSGECTITNTSMKGCFSGKWSRNGNNIYIYGKNFRGNGKYDTETLTILSLDNKSLVICNGKRDDDILYFTRMN